MMWHKRCKPVCTKLGSAGIFLLLCLLLTVNGCERSAIHGEGQTDIVGEDPLPLTIMMVYHEKEPAEDDPVIKAIENLTNTELDITWVPELAYDHVVSATIASGKMPDVMLVRDFKQASIVHTQMSSIFWDIQPFLKDTVNIRHLHPKLIEDASIDGKLYGVPRMRATARHGLIVRKDWLERLGLAKPQTTEEFYHVAKAMVEGDPDGNGLADTYGLEMNHSLEALKQMSFYFGGPNEWGLRDGWVMPDFLFPQYKEAMQLLRKMIREELINRDFPLSTKHKYFNQGKAGMYFSTLDDALRRHEELYVREPDAVLDVIQIIHHPSSGEVDGTEDAERPRVKGSPGYDGMLVIPKSNVPSEEKARRILQFIDQLGSPEIMELLEWGDEVSAFMWANDAYMTQGDQSPFVESIATMVKEHEAYAIRSLTNALFSEETAMSGERIERIIYEAQVHYLLNDLTDEDWQQAVTAWRSGGGNTLIFDYTAQYYDRKRQ